MATWQVPGGTLGNARRRLLALRLNDFVSIIRSSKQQFHVLISVSRAGARWS
jgi:hypothetical protein